MVDRFYCTGGSSSATFFTKARVPQSSTSEVASQCATRVANIILASKRCRDRLPRLCGRAISSIKSTVDADIAGTTTVGVSLCMNICLEADLVETELVAESFKVARDVALDLFMSPRWHLKAMTRRASSFWAEDLCERRLDSRQACVDDSQGRLQDVKDSPRSNVVGQITLIPTVYPNGSDQGNGADPREYEICQTPS